MEGKKRDYLALLQAAHPYARFLVVGDGREEHAAALELGMPFFEITRGSCSRATSDLKRLRKHLTEEPAAAPRPKKRSPARERGGRPGWQ